MNEGMNGGSTVRVRIGTLRVTARSPVEARRLADALPAALERALSRAVAEDDPNRDSAAAGRTPLRQDPVDRVADAVATQVRVRLDAARELGDRT